MDFEELFKDVEEIEHGHPEGEQELPPPASDDNLLSLSEVATAVASPGVSAVIEREDPDSVGASSGPNNTTWSTTSLSEDSDDGSRSSLSGSNCCAFEGVSPASGPTRSPAEFSPGNNSSTGSNIEAPRSVTSEASTATNDNNASVSTNSKRLLSVSSGAGTPILPFTFAPAFGGGGTPGGTLPNFSGLQAAALAAAASGVAGQALAAGWKRLRGGDDGSSAGAHGQACPASVEGGAGASSRLLCGGGAGDGGSGGSGVGAGQTRTNKRAKREERLMKNREAANRSRVKVGGSQDPGQQTTECLQ